MAGNRYTRSPLIDQPIRDSGPYEAIVVNHFDRMSMGTLEVELLKYTQSNGTPERSGQLVTVRYLSPFYGVTPYKGLTENDGYENTQKSYGFWAVPPDPGTRVLVIFAEGNAAFGYWIGCIQDQGMNFMVPDGRASTVRTTDGTPEPLSSKKLPVGEYNKKIETGVEKDPTLFRKPYNKDFTNVLQVQGLLNDEARGTTTTSARRETPSMVFGISTPGPLDRRQNSPTYKYGATDDNADFPFNRLGGSSFVMDDGDDKFIRATHAEDGPPVYLNRENGETGGDETIPQNELMRFRTRTGHQILLHNSEDLIYISNSRGTAWIELTSDGKIDIHAQDSISIMSDTDINFTAERDFNVDAGRNINMRATARWSDFKVQEDGLESGRVQIEAKHNMNLLGETSLNISSNDLNIENSSDFKLHVDGDFHLYATENVYIESRASTHLTSANSFFQYVKNNYHVDIDENSYFTTFKDQHRKAGFSHVLSDGNITTNPNGASIYDESNNEIHLRTFSRSGDPWQPNFYYLKDYTVTYNNQDWKALIEHRAGQTFDQTKWETTGVGTGTIYISAEADIHTDAGNSIYNKSSSEIHNKAGSSIYTDAAAAIYNTAGSSLYNDVAGNFNIQAGSFFSADASEIYLNSGLSNAGSPATDALSASPAIMSVESASTILSEYTKEEVPPKNFKIISTFEPLDTYTLPYVIPGVEQPIPYESILLRAPQHEPWSHHENMNPLSFKKQETDRELSKNVETADRILTPDTFLKNKAGLQSSVRIAGSGGNINSLVGSRTSIETENNQRLGNDDARAARSRNEDLDKSWQNRGEDPGTSVGEIKPAPPGATGASGQWNTYDPVPNGNGLRFRGRVWSNGANESQIDPALADIGKRMAARLGVELFVNSAYRDATKNTSVGGASSSAHMRGYALDLSWDEFDNTKREEILIAAIEEGAQGIGFYPTFLHIDIGNKRSWNVNKNTSSFPWAPRIMRQAGYTWRS